MFYGEFEYKIDQKGRVPIPPRFRKELREGLVLTPGIERCIIVHPLSEWKKIAAELTNGLVASSSKLRRLNRAIFATSFSARIDGQGRIVLPMPLREHAEIMDEVIMSAAIPYLELWNKVHWESEKATSQEQVGQIIESLEKH